MLVDPKQFSDRHDYHSYGNPEQIRVKHVDLNLSVSFEDKKLKGTATLSLDQTASAPLVLDTRALKVFSVETSTNGGTEFSKAEFKTGATDPILGAPLTITVPRGVTHVRITYETSPDATALQWLSPEQTAGKKAPFLYTQSEAIHARSWVPLQDSPGVRMTYSAKIRVPKGLMAVMSAKNTIEPNPNGEYTFDMPQAIPSYLMALAVGDLGYHAFSRRTGVYAEPSVLPKAAAEFEDTEKMVQAAESLYGPYRWQQYDILILPPSFPYGGMENPRLTFLTPTLLAGDKSLVGVVSHELAHSWSGNLVTNATWRDFWLNEGFTTYFERRIQEQVYGRDRSEMEAKVEKQQLLDEMKTLKPQDQVLYIDLKGRDPDEGSTLVPYDKGMLLLRLLEETYGRERFDGFLRSYFEQYQFRSITTGDFVSYLNDNLLNRDMSLAGKIGLYDWLTKPGLPANAPEPKSNALEQVTVHAQNWVAGKEPLSAIPAAKWSTAEWQHFLLAMPQDLSREKMTELDDAYHLTQSGNAEIKFQWLMMAIRAKYEPAYGELRRFLIEVGRRKFVKPLFQELAKTPEGKKQALAIYAEARQAYHPITSQTIDTLLK